MSDWKDNLNEEQLKNAIDIAERARLAGVPPNLAVAMAYQESRLKHFVNNSINTSPKGALGIMQITTDTAKYLGIDPQDKDQNIDGGIKYIKSLLARYDNDPKLAAVAYNHGPSGSFFKGGNLPKESKEYLEKIASINGFDPYVPSDSSGSSSGQTQPTGYGNAAQQIVGGVGAGAGTMVGLARQGISTGANYLKDKAGNFITNSITNALNNADATQGLAQEGQNLLPEAQGRMAGTPAGGRMTQNWARSANMIDPIALKARSQAEAYKLQLQDIEAQDKIKQLMGGRGSQYELDPQRASLMINKNLQPAPAPVSKYPKGLLETYFEPYKDVASQTLNKFAPFAGRLASGALGGYGAGVGGVEALERYKNDDTAGASLAGLSALGSLGTVLSVPYAIPAAVAGGVGLTALDIGRATAKNIQSGEEWTKKHPPTLLELEAAKQAYFGRARPRSSD
jgi:hypothetical protein